MGHPSKPIIGLVGSQGAYGRWLRRFFSEQMGLRVIGRDPAGDTTMSPREMIEGADVLVFCAPIRHTAELIRDYVALSDGAERGKLWMDLTSIKHGPVAELLRSQAEVVGLHPMTAPPKIPTLKGRVLAVCPARLHAWRDWLAVFLAATRAQCVTVEPERHDKAMALVQGLVHAGHLAQASVLRELAPEVGGLEGLHPLRTVGYELDLTVSERILSGNPAIYEDIQFENPHVLPALDRLAAALDLLRDAIRRGNDAARQQVREQLLGNGAAFFGQAALAAGSHGFERLGYLMADLEEPNFLSVFLPEDHPGSLRRLLVIFEQRGINLVSIHSSRTADGDLLFRIGLDPQQAQEMAPDALSELMADIRATGIERVIVGNH